MLRGTRPTAALAATAVVLVGALSACGSDTPGTGLPFGDRLDAVTISGDVGEAKVEFKERMNADKLESETLVEGEGDKLEDEDTVFVDYVLGDGYTQKAAIDSVDGGAAALELTVGAKENAEPATLDDVLSNVLRNYVKAGVTKGSRVVVTGDTEAMFGGLAQSPALASQGIGNDDGLVLVVDVLDVTPLQGPQGTPAKRPDWAPTLDFNGNGPNGFDFAGIPEPDAKDALQSAAIIKGDGDKVEEGDLLVLDYLGSLYDADKPFDQSYSKEPIKAPAGSFVPGFNEAIEGQTVGSRVLIRIPPAKGYGKQGQGKTIPPGSTLYFVVDILAAI